MKNFSIQKETEKNQNDLGIIKYNKIGISFPYVLNTERKMF